MTRLTMTDRFFRLLRHLRVPAPVYYWLLDRLTDNNGWRPLHMREDLSAAGAVTVQITADLTGYLAALDKLKMTTERIRWQTIQRRERLAARSWFDQHAETAWSRYGWTRPDDRYDWPMPRRGR